MMNYFFSLINLLETLIFTVFITSYFHLSKKYLYLTSIIYFCILSYFEYIQNNGLILTIVIIFFMSLSIIIEKKNINIDYFFIVLLFECLLFSSNFLGVFLLDILQYFLIDHTLSIIIVNIFAKFILLIISFSILKLKLNLSISLEIKKWFWLILYTITLLSTVVILTSYLITQEQIRGIFIFILFLLNILVLLFVFIIYKIHFMNLNIVEKEKLEQLKKYNQDKLDTIKYLKNDIDVIEHRMIYVLVKLKYSIENNKLDNAKELIDSYMKTITKNKLILNTNNTVFDTVIGLKINELKTSGINVNVSILISENTFYNDLTFINLIINFLEIFKQVKYLNIQIEQIDENVKIKFVYKNGYVNVDEIIKLLNKHENVFYSIEDHEHKGFRILFRMLDYE